MGWFDKKSWQLRKKIRDLQSELAIAERNGKYVVEQGLFFAELQEMGESTMIILGAADQLDSEEESVIRNFFERNGFSIDELRLDKTHKTLAHVEIIPPEELTRRVAKQLKDQGFRIVDDSEQERSADVDKKIITLSALIRTLSALFAGHVHQLIISTPIKMNMEGNRLLHWMPRIREVLTAKVPPAMPTICLEPFIEAYNHYYGRFGRLETPEALRELTEESAVRDVSSEMQFDHPETVLNNTTPATGSASWARSGTASLTLAPASLSHRAASESSPATESASNSHRETHAARTLAHMYKSLIGASSERKVRNSELLLDDITRFFEAKSACLLVRETADSSIKLHANAGSSFCMATNENGFVACETETLKKALETSALAVSPPHGNGNTNPEAVAIPMRLGDGALAVLYLLEPAGFSPSSETSDSRFIEEFSKVFREFPDLLL